MPKTNTPAPGQAGERTPRAKRTKAAASPGPATSTQAKRPTRSSVLIELMRIDGGASVQELAAAVGWQVHSVRGFIAGTLKKRNDLTVKASRNDGVTRYHLADAVEAKS